MKEQLLFLKNLVTKVKEINLNLDNLLKEYETKNKELENLKNINNNIKDLSKKRRKLKFGLIVSIYNLLFLISILSLIIISHLIYLPFFASLLITISLLIPLILSVEGIITINPKKISKNITKITNEINDNKKEQENKNIKKEILKLEKELELNKKEIIKLIETNPALITIFSKNNSTLENINNIEKIKCYKL